MTEVSFTALELWQGFLLFGYLSDYQDLPNSLNTVPLNVSHPPILRRLGIMYSSIATSLICPGLQPRPKFSQKSEKLQNQSLTQ